MDSDNDDWYSLENTKTKPQTEKLDYFQTEDSAGGYSYKVTDTTLLKRFLILGTESATYYCTEKELKRENAACIDRLVIAGRGNEVVESIRIVSVEGRSCKQDTIIFALALCARSNDPETKTLAYKILPEVCRIPTHLFQFIRYCENESAGTGWGRAHRRAISTWYKGFAEDPKKLAYLVTKYKTRSDWSHKDVVRLAHVKPTNLALSFIIRYIAKGLDEAKKIYNAENLTDPKVLEVHLFLEAVEQAHSCTDENSMIKLINEFNLAREHVPTELLRSSEVWQALIQRMPMTAMIRNLGKMSSMGLTNTATENESRIVTNLRNKEYLRKSKIHPFTVLVAQGQYKKGHGEKGKLNWPVNQNIVTALEDAFHLTFDNVQPTGKRFLLAIDVSGSMNTPICGNPAVSARDAAAAMMMVTFRVETNVRVVAFSRGLTKMNIGKEDTLSSVIKTCSYMDFSSTDCSLPITYATKNKKKIDVFIVYTDSETYAGVIHPSEALVKYRKASGIPDARLIVVGMASNGFSIANPNDPYMMDVVGFDTNAPAAMEHFINGKIM